MDDAASGRPTVRVGCFRRWEQRTLPAGFHIHSLYQPSTVKGKTPETLYFQGFLAF